MKQTRMATYQLTPPPSIEEENTEVLKSLLSASILMATSNSSHFTTLSYKTGIAVVIPQEEQTIATNNISAYLINQPQFPTSSVLSTVLRPTKAIKKEPDTRQEVFQTYQLHFTITSQCIYTHQIPFKVN